MNRFFLHFLFLISTLLLTLNGWAFQPNPMTEDGGFSGQSFNPMPDLRNLERENTITIPRNSNISPTDYSPQNPDDAPWNPIERNMGILPDPTHPNPWKDLDRNLDKTPILIPEPMNRLPKASTFEKDNSWFTDPNSIREALENQWKENFPNSSPQQPKWFSNMGNDFSKVENKFHQILKPWTQEIMTRYSGEFNKLSFEPDFQNTLSGYECYEDNLCRPVIVVITIIDSNEEYYDCSLPIIASGSEDEGVNGLSLPDDVNNPTPLCLPQF